MNTFIIILSFDHTQLTKRCISSVRSIFQDDQILVVHNGSEISNVSHLKDIFPNLIHLVLEKNMGFCGGMNAGLNYFYKHTTMLWCLALTNDTELLEFDFKIESSPAQLIAPLIYFKSLRKIDSWGAKYNLFNGKLYHLKSRDVEEVPQYVPGTAYFVHREIIAQKLLFNESLFIFWDDVYWSFMIKKAGFLISRSDTIKVSHGGGKSTKKDSQYTTYYYQRNRLYVSYIMQDSFIKKVISLINISIQMKIQILKLILKGKFKRAQLLAKALHDAVMMLLKSASQ